MNDQCTECQMALSEALDTPRAHDQSLIEPWLEHIEECPVCREFYKMWNADTTISSIASRPLTAEIHPATMNKIMDSVLTEHEAQSKVITRFWRPTLVALGAAAAIVVGFNILTPKPTPVTDPVADTPPTTASPVAYTPLSERVTAEKIRNGYSVVNRLGVSAWRGTTSDLRFIKNYVSKRGADLKVKISEMKSDTETNEL